MGNGQWSVHHTLSLMLLPPQEDSSTLHLLQWGIPLSGDNLPLSYPMWVLSTSCNSSLTAPAVLHGVTSPASNPNPAWVHVFQQDPMPCQEPDPVWNSHRIAASFWYICRSSTGCRLISTPPHTSTSCRDSASSWQSAPWAAKKSLLLCLEHLILLLGQWLGVCRAISLIFSHSSVTAAIVVLQ